MQIPQEMKEEVKEILNGLKQEVILRVFSLEKSPSSEENLELMQSLAELSPLLKVEAYDFSKDKEATQKWNVEMAPVVLIHNQNSALPMRFYGIPSGYEFGSLLESILLAGGNPVDLPQEIEEEVKKIQTPKKIKVFVTPSCPYCAPAVLTAFKIALLNPEYIQAAMIEATEFQSLAMEYQVRAVPKIIVNHSSFEGNLPPLQFVKKIKEA